ncbi:MAG: hypothetical protein K5821_14235 [Nitrobacter sp.]|uniref:hypothetical protein n=1 Tax=Nitrobacter sp. TaxID=29420 RepID=UPI0026314E87|nr:hypothetical protein [Nitrobacter sp.]MCV0387556.1 hypothetical protein [Nitrobacter sp.]
MVIVVVPASGQTSPSDITLEDYERFNQLKLRIRPIGTEMVRYIRASPLHQNLSETVRSKDCMIHLYEIFEGFEDKFGAITSLVGLAANMRDHEDRQLTTKVLNLHAREFLASAPLVMRIIDNRTKMSGCSQDGAVVAKSQEMKSTLKDIQMTLVPIAKRVGAKTSRHD